MIGRLHHLVLDCPDPLGLASFYSALLGQPITYVDAGWVVVSADQRSSGLAFQRVDSHRAPTWPRGSVPQQMHFDVMVDDVTAAGAQVLALGAVSLGGHGVFADPAGHPFCLIHRPSWAETVDGDDGSDVH